jgi:hypothetical protein
METHRWECSCGESGWFSPKRHSQKALNRAAVEIHRCPNPYIAVEAREEYERRQLADRLASIIEGPRKAS